MTAKVLRNRIVIVGVLVLLVSSALGVTAYLSDTASITNTLKIGGVNVKIIEDFDPPGKLEPGTSFTKDVAVKNEGPTDAYIRIKAVFTDGFMGNYCTVDWNTTDYVYNSSDGYYYYKNVVKVGDTSKSLFTTVKLSSSISQSAIKDFDILVYAEAYQADGFSTYNEAWEHFKRNK